MYRQVPSGLGPGLVRTLTSKSTMSSQHHPQIIHSISPTRGSAAIFEGIDFMRDMEQCNHRRSLVTDPLLGHGPRQSQQASRTQLASVCISIRPNPISHRDDA